MNNRDTKPKWSSYKTKCNADTLRFFPLDNTRIAIHMPKTIRHKLIEIVEDNTSECEYCKIYLSKCYCNDN